MQVVTVYRVNYVNGEKVPIGTIVERRKKGRPGNLSGLLLVARKTFSSNPQEAIQIALDHKALTYA